MSNFSPLYLLFVLQALDIISTVIGLRNPLIVESNRLLNPLFNRFGALPVLLAVKAGFIAYLYVYQAQFNQEVLWITCAGYAYVVANNFHNIYLANR